LEPQPHGKALSPDGELKLAMVDAALASNMEAWIDSQDALLKQL